MNRLLAAIENPLERRLEDNLEVLAPRPSGAAPEKAVERPRRPKLKAQAAENVAEIDAAEQVLGGKACDAGAAARVVLGAFLRIAQNGVGLGDLPEAVGRVGRSGWYLRASWRNASLTRRPGRRPAFHSSRADRPAIPSEADEEARRAYREREDLTRERRSIVNKIDGILATLGVKGYKALRRDRREQLNCARQPGGDPIPQKARARIERLLDRLDLVLKLIDQVESARDAVLKKDAPADEAERMIRSLTDLRSIGPDVATLLVREAFVRQFRNRRALAGYVGLGGTPFSSGGSEREQGIGKDGNRRVRAAMVELAWMWLRWQPDSALSVWFRVRVGAMGGRIRKIMIVALARKLLVALWRYVTDGVVPDGAKLKAA